MANRFEAATAAAHDSYNYHSGGPTVEEECSGLRLSEYSLSPGDILYENDNDDPVVMAVLAGDLLVNSSSGITSWPERSVGFFPPSAQLEFQAVERPALLLRIEILPHSLENLGGRPDCLRRLAILNSGELSVLAHRIHRELRSFDEQAPLAIRGLFLELLSRAAREDSAQRNPRPPRCLALAKRIIEERFPETLRLPDIAEEVGVHHVYLARVFRRFCHCSVGEYLRKTRVDWATARLAEDQLSVAEIAIEAGFSDQSHLTRVFKNLTGLTPARYRSERRLEISRIEDARRR
jgi:AraC-like DNA-binding protein